MSALPDASRVAFEIHLHSLPNFPVSPLEWTYQRDTLGNYCNNRVDDMWHGWKASREQALEEAANVCRNIFQGDESEYTTHIYCANKIEDLLK